MEVYQEPAIPTRLQSYPFQWPGFSDFKDEELLKLAPNVTIHVSSPTGQSEEGSDTVTDRPSNFRWRQFYRGKPTFRQLTGWRGGLAFAIAADVLVLLLICTFYIRMVKSYECKGTECLLLQGECPRAVKGSTWLHLAINICSTTLLSTSSYAMQCLGSPTRAEVNAAHAKEQYLNIGASSLRNLRFIRRKRAVLYCVLACTSIPIHLLANSAVYNVEDANAYAMFVVSKDWETAPTSYWNGSCELLQPEQQQYGSLPLQNISKIFTERSILSRTECIKEYSRAFVSGRRHVLAVSAFQADPNTPESSNNSVFVPACRFHSPMPSLNYFHNESFWTCSFSTRPLSSHPACNTAKAIKNADQFSIGGYPIDHCLSEEVPKRCKLYGNIAILLVVIVCATSKLLILVATMRTLPVEILATAGDAIASFLAAPEPRTDRSSLLTSQDVVRTKNHGYRNTKRWIPGTPLRKSWDTGTLQLPCGDALPISLRAWAFFVPLASMGALVISFLLAMSIRQPVTLVWNRIGIAAPYYERKFYENEQSDRNTQFNGPGGLPISMTSNQQLGGSLIEVALQANGLQLLLSISYFAFNQSWTMILLGKEWARFGRERRTLRVTQPVAPQRSNYFLTIPYRFAVPLQIVAVTLHWLLSQSIFVILVEISYDDRIQSHPHESVKMVGYSPMAMIYFCSLFTLLLIVYSVFERVVKVNSPIPVVGGCSVAISAACHPPAHEEDVWLKPLKWGIVDSRETGGVLHCALSSNCVRSPEDLPFKPMEHGQRSRSTIAEFE